MPEQNNHILFRDRWIDYIHSLQDRICKGLEEADGSAVFKEDQWEREEGGGGKTRIIND
uniref:coproporphyrinogen III oxidase n=1 Tax=Serratia marcescens TaxID=615 RepID=UPI0013D98031